MAKNWDIHVNKKAYGQQGGYEDNLEVVQMKSGRVVSHKLNSTARKTHNLKFTFEDSEKKSGLTEFEWFLKWYNETLENGVEHFYFPDVITHDTEKEYRLEGAPSWTGQKFKEVGLTFVEV